jgi:protein tyrosine/serine phosphatase
MPPSTDKTGVLVGASDTHDSIQSIDLSCSRGGIHNVRAIEGVQISGRVHIKNGVIIRSANLDSVGQWQAERFLHRYGVKAIFDLRDERDIGKKSETTCGIPVYRLSALHAVDPEVVATYFQGLSQDTPSAFASFYMHICALSEAAFKTIFTYIRDNPDCPFLVHCELGKDRTGVFISILLQVLGVSEDYIIGDYHLSQFAIKPIIAKRVERLHKHPLIEGLSIAPEALDNHFLALQDSMRLFIGAFRDNYGDGSGYLRSLGFSCEDIASIQSNLTCIQ